MRTIPADLNTELIKTHGVEAITVIEVLWENGGSRLVYADRDTSFAQGRIQVISNLDFVINVNGNSDSAEISTTLSDTDGHLKGILDTVDPHKKSVWVYQYVDGTDYPADRALVFSGEINSPIRWDEGARTVSFNIINKIEDAEIGLSLEEGQFPNLDPELIGQPLPLKFGSTTRVPAVRLESILKGTLATSFGIKDPTLSYRLEKAQQIICPKIFNGYYARYNVFGSLILEPQYVDDPSCASNRCATIANLETAISEQGSYEYEKIRILGGEDFPQTPEVITLDIDGAELVGTMDGEVFTIISRTHPEEDELLPLNDDIVQAILDAEQTNDIAECGINQTYDADGNLTGQTGELGNITAGISTRTFEFYNAIPTGSFFWAPTGSRVILKTDEPIVYVSNILEETIHQVQAYRNFDSGRKLVAVPSTWYTTRSTDYTTYDVSEIVMTIPLSTRDESWEDDIYVNSTSTIGPNTVDIMEWLIDKYTNLTYDATSFDYVKTRLEEYPSDFPLLERKNILQVLKEIAFQCRCAIYIRDNVFYLKYLPELPTSVDTIADADVNVNTLEMTHTDTEELVTKLTAKWKWDYSIDDSNQIILRHNIKKYGTQEEEFDFYIYHELDYVHKSASFWLIRKANTWKKLKFSTSLHLFKLETFDGVDIDISHLSGDTIRSLITKSDYNSNRNLLDFEVWTPVRAGETEAYDFAYPADIAEELIWPTEKDRSEGNIGSGDAPGFSAEVTADGHPMNYGEQQTFGGFQFGPCRSQTGIYDAVGSYTPEHADQTCGGGNGDTFPSDTGDSKITRSTEDGSAPDSPVNTSLIQTDLDPSGKLGELSEINELKRQLKDLQEQVQRATQLGSDANEAAGGDGSSGENADNPFKELPDPDSQTCSHQVEVVTWYYTSVNQSDGTRTTAEGATGRGATGFPMYSQTFSFACYCEAVEFQNKMSADIQNRKSTYSEPNKQPTIAQTFLSRDTSEGCNEGEFSCAEGAEEPTLPTPTGYSEDISDSATTESAGGVVSPTEWWDDLGLEAC